MSYYQLNSVQNILSINNFNFVGSNTYNKDVEISKTLHSYLNKAKTEIDSYYNMWDQVKKITNPYEYIHTQIPSQKISVCKHKPLSRSYFKFIELANTFNLLKNLGDNISSFHLAEGPGGFIEAISNLRKNDNDRYFGMTLLNSDVNVPGWQKSQHFLNKNSNVIIEKGDSDDGDLLNPQNLSGVHFKYKNSMDIITGDGGFDFSIDFNQQESMSAKLIFAQICYAIIMQKKGGHFILKFFDTFSKASIQMIYILNTFYENVYIIKPNTSRYANSERYVVCKNFLLKKSDEYLLKLQNILTDMKNYNFIDSLLSVEIPYFYIIRLEEVNAILGQQQLESIVYTLNLIQNNSKDLDNKIEQIINSNIQKCISWCVKHNLSHNKMINVNNIKHVSFIEKKDNEKKLFINNIDEY